ncbi:MAG TPA: hypothetical protein VK604_03600 [Bryobacteraceae bacterium]|nr:hypothetical protein [Bryobacteraceae bacterium]
MLARHSELGVMLMQKSEFLQLQFLRARVILQSLNALFLGGDFARQVCVLFFKQADLTVFFRQGV